MPSPCARHRPSPASCTRSCRWIHPQWVPRRHGKCEMQQTARSLERTRADRGERPMLACPCEKDRCFLSPEPRFYPLGQMFAFGRARASSLQIRAFEDSAARRSHSRRFWVLEHGPSLFSSETRLELPDRPRFGHNTRERPTWTSSHPLASPGHTPGDRTEGFQDPRTRTKLLRAPRYLEI